jgi:hypothetical protein
MNYVPMYDVVPRKTLMVSKHRQLRTRGDRAHKQIYAGRYMYDIHPHIGLRLKVKMDLLRICYRENGAIFFHSVRKCTSPYGWKRIMTRKNG